MHSVRPREMIMRRVPAALTGLREDACDGSLRSPKLRREEEEEEDFYSDSEEEGVFRVKRNAGNDRETPRNSTSPLSSAECK
jgi:hypothetical protein